MDIYAPMIVQFVCGNARKAFVFLEYTEDSNLDVLTPRDFLNEPTAEEMAKPQNIGITFEYDAKSSGFILRTLLPALRETPDQVQIYIWEARFIYNNRNHEPGQALIRWALRPHDTSRTSMNMSDEATRIYDQTPIGDKPISAPMTIDLSSVWSPGYIMQPPSAWLRGDDPPPQEIRDHFNLTEPDDRMLDNHPDAARNLQDNAQ